MRVRAVVAVTTLLLASLSLPSAAEPARCRGENLRLRFQLNRREYTLDQRVRMKMVVINKGPRCTMVWSDGQVATFYVFEDDRKIWDEDYCRAFTQAIMEEVWGPDRREVYRARWSGWRNGRDCQRRAERAGPGHYEAQGHFMGDGEPRTERVAFRVTR